MLPEHLVSDVVADWLPWRMVSAVRGMLGANALSLMLKVVFNVIVLCLRNDGHCAFHLKKFAAVLLARRCKMSKRDGTERSDHICSRPSEGILEEMGFISKVKDETDGISVPRYKALAAPTVGAFSLFFFAVHSFQIVYFLYF